MNENHSYSPNNATSKIPEHPDYGRNLNWGSKFFKNYNDKFARHMTLRVVKNTDGEKYFFEFSFVIPYYQGNHNCFATPIDPNQDNEKFMNGFRNAYYEYLKIQRKWDDKSKYRQEFMAFDPK